jgi:hypothetical protein
MAVPTSDEITLLVKPIGAEAREVVITAQEFGEMTSEFLRLGYAPSLHERVGADIEFIGHQDKRRASGRVRKVA